MYAEERHRSIVNRAMRQERVSVTELAEEFGVTTETIRRDLDALDQRGLIRRVHGGAVAANGLTVLETGLAEREAAGAAQKARIAEAALRYLPSQPGTVLLDAGTTTGRLAARLGANAVTAVVTNSLPAAGQLAANGVRVRLLGGNVRGITGATVGSETVTALSRLRCDVAFVGTNGISVQHGFSTPDHDEAAVKEAMVGAASFVVVLADSSKLGAELLVGFAALNQADVLITDDGIDAADVADLRAAGVEVVIA
ncbi:MAG: DeoR/GlpR family DNA-binding transcription regulator [Propionibacteriales bacterium]|nr:DeoR/GlpR family DNA-binding transcription regulator [Propionibacteriales bacterium]